MAAHQRDQLKTDADGAMGSSPAAPTAPEAGRYEIDTSCSAVAFRTRHLFGLAPVRGSFAVRAGTVDVTEPVTGSRATPRSTRAASVPATGRDGHVRSARLLAAGRYPVLAFRSGGLEGQALAGTLKVRDVTLPVSVSVEQSAVTPGSFTARATTRIDRDEFGVTAYRGLAGALPRHDRGGPVRTQVTAART